MDLQRIGWSEIPKGSTLYTFMFVKILVTTRHGNGEGLSDPQKPGV